MTKSKAQINYKIQMLKMRFDIKRLSTNNFPPFVKGGEGGFIVATLAKSP